MYRLCTGSTALVVLTLVAVTFADSVYLGSDFRFFAAEPGEYIVIEGELDLLLHMKSGKGIWMVLFFQDDCEYCWPALEEWERVIEMAPKYIPDVTLGEIDMEEWTSTMPYRKKNKENIYTQQHYPSRLPMVIVYDMDAQLYYEFEYGTNKLGTTATAEDLILFAANGYREVHSYAMDVTLKRSIAIEHSAEFITDGNFDAKIKPSETWFILFYNINSRMCKMFIQKFVDFTIAVEERGLPIRVGLYEIPHREYPVFQNLRAPHRTLPLLALMKDDKLWWVPTEDLFGGYEGNTISLTDKTDIEELFQFIDEGYKSVKPVLRNRRIHDEL